MAVSPVLSDCRKAVRFSVAPMLGVTPAVKAAQALRSHDWPTNNVSDRSGKQAIFIWESALVSCSFSKGKQKYFQLGVLCKPSRVIFSSASRV